MKLVIDYHEGKAYVEDAYRGDVDRPRTVREYSQKYIRKCLQDKAKREGYVGLEFWAIPSEEIHPSINGIGYFQFDVLGLGIYHLIGGVS